MPVIKVLKPGLLTTIQDQGRIGYAHLGVPQSGALDKEAARRANLLVGNQPTAPVLEITLSGPRLAFLSTAQIAITGAEMSPCLDHIPIPNNQLIKVISGQILDFGPCVWGCRAYLAIQGEWRVAYWLGSASRALAPATSCTPRAWLRGGEVLHIDSIVGGPQRIAADGAQRSRAKDGSGSLPEHQPLRDSGQTNNEQPDPRHPKRGEGGAGEHPYKKRLLTLKVDPAPEYHQMTSAWIRAFLSHRFTLSTAINRMGCRLKERMRVPEGLGTMLSSGVLPGTVQLTPEGRLIILLADAQTTGGYYRIAQLRMDALNALAQLKAGDKVEFRLISRVF